MTSVLYVPPKGDPRGVLNRGICGARVPIASLVHINDTTLRWLTGELNAVNYGVPRVALALVLAWEGRVSPEGCDRAARIYAAGIASELWIVMRPTMDDVAKIAELLVSRCGGEIVTVELEKP